MADVYILGTGMTPFGELWQFDLRELAVKAALDAVNDANLKLADIDALFVANMSASRFVGQEHLGALIASELGLDVPAMRVEGACASGGLALHAAFLALQSGLYKNVLVVGAEKMTDVDAPEVTKALSGAADEEWEAYYGVTFPSLYAMMAREHMRKYGTTREDMALVSVKNHANAALNSKAQFQKQISLDDVVSAAVVAEPLGLFDCSPISDGAAAVVLSSSHKSARAEMIACAVAQSSLSLHDRAEITTIDATVKAAARAYAQAGITAADISCAEVHDCFSIAEIIAYEDLGFINKGKGKDLIRSGNTKLDGKLPVNTSGGLKACGHPVGATGIKQIIELSLQLSGMAGARQVKRQLSYGLAHNVGGSGATAVVSIIKHV